MRSEKWTACEQGGPDTPPEWACEAPSYTGIGELDLRRRPDARLAGLILDRAEWLPAGERTLVELVYRDGRTTLEVAALLGKSPRQVRRRVRRATQRLLDPLTAYVVASAPGWPPTRRRVARSCVVEGASMREASDELGVSLHTVRRHMEIVRELCAETRRGGRAGIRRLAASHALTTEQAHPPSHPSSRSTNQENAFSREHAWR